MKHFSLAWEVKQHDIIEMVTNCKKWDQQKTKLCYTFTFCHMDFLFIKLYWQHCSSVSTCLWIISKWINFINSNYGWIQAVKPEEKSSTIRNGVVQGLYRYYKNMTLLTSSRATFILPDLKAWASSFDIMHVLYS